MGVEPGMRLGHEFAGVVVAAGKDVHTVKVGDRVVASAMFVAGECHSCKKALPPACEHGDTVWRYRALHRFVGLGLGPVVGISPIRRIQGLSLIHI